MTRVDWNDPGDLWKREEEDQDARESRNWRVFWLDKRTGLIGAGPPSFPKDEAETLAQELDAKYPLVTHWASL